jgi:predicted nicotinamide N-methyase
MRSWPPALPSEHADEEALRRRFRVVATQVSLGAQSVELLRPESSDALITEEDYVRDERLPYWADLWPSSFVLARHLAVQEGRGRRLLELGCGVGLVAVAAARAGFRVTATDYYEDALEFASVNVARNGSSAPVVRMIDWRALPADLGTFDIVVASDVLYEVRYPALVAAVLARALAPTGEGLIADPGRVAAPELPSECEARGLAVTGRVSVPYDEGEIHQTIDLISIGWARPQG